MFRVLFLCTGNSARSQIAEALLNQDGAGRFEAESGGTEPAAKVNPGAVQALAKAGIEWRGRAPRSVEGLDRQRWDLVVTVCDDARESCPVFPAGPVITHWGMPDPAAVRGDEATRRAAFVETLAVLRRRIEALVRLPVESLLQPALEARVKEIAGIQ
jgi:protein-tyrosine-phosphatase